jgi:hypothetical protein
MKRIHATATGERIKLGLICASRRDADAILERLYPEAVYTSTIVRKHREAAPC